MQSDMYIELESSTFVTTLVIWKVNISSLLKTKIFGCILSSPCDLFSLHFSYSQASCSSNGHFSIKLYRVQQSYDFI